MRYRSRKHSFSPLFWIFLMVIVVCIASYFFVSPKKSIPVDRRSISPTPLTKKVTEWVKKEEKECGVIFSVPGSSSWDVSKRSVYPDMLSLFLEGNQEYKQSAVMQAQDSQGKQVISAAVVVSCIPNIHAYTTERMMQMFSKKIDTYNKGIEKKSIHASSYMLTASKSATRWDRQVYDVSMEQSHGMRDYTLFATPSFLYEVSGMVSSDEAHLGEEAKKIFETIIFQ